MTTWLANLNGFHATTAKTNTFKLGVNNIVNVIMHYFTLIQWTQIDWFNELKLKLAAVFLHTIPHHCRTVWKLKPEKQLSVSQNNCTTECKNVAFWITLLMDGFSHLWKLNIK